jgi:hypothetical protein
MGLCLKSDNCKTCSEIEMGIYANKNRDIGFSKSDMRKTLGNKFCEDAWQRFVSRESSKALPTFSYLKEYKKWFSS